MKGLITLVELISNSKFRTKGLLNIILEPGTQLRLLFDALAEGQVQTSEQALALSKQWSMNATRFQSIKSKLKDRLNDAVLLLDFHEADYGERQTAFVECTKNWAIAMTLIAKGARSNAIQLLEVIHRQSRRFEFTEVRINILRALRLHACIFSGELIQFNNLDQEMEELETLWVAEKKVEDLYSKLMMEYAASRSDKKPMADQAEAYWVQIRDELEKHSSYKIQLFGRLIWIAIYENRNDYVTTAEICRDSIAFFTRKDYRSHSVMQIFHYTLCICHLNLRQYQQCREAAESFRQLFEPGEYNWFKFEELNFYTAVHEGSYHDAWQQYQSVVSHPAFSAQPPSLIETWRIFEGYLYLLKALGHLPEMQVPNKYRIHKMMNDLQTCVKDKSGMNVPVQVLCFLLPLAEGNFSHCIDREEALAKYRSRYLDLGEAARSHHFFHMLCALPKSGFDPEKVQHRSREHAEKLRSVPLEAANQNHEIEIVPYEILWDMTLAVLHKQHKQAPANLLLAGAG